MNNVLSKDERGDVLLRNSPVHQSILIVGLGNPILGDDGIGWRVVDRIQSNLATEAGIEFDLLSLGGLSLMERLIGYERVIIVDAITTRENPLGTISVLPLKDLPNQALGHMTSAHDTTLQSAIEMGKKLGASLPAEIIVVGVETDLIFDFTEQLSPPVEAAIPQVEELVLELLADWVDEMEISHS